jgi:hypothetical protein
MFLFFLIRAEEDPIRPVVFCATLAESIDKVIEMWVDPKQGYVPSHMNNVRYDLDKDATENEVRAYAISETRKRFGVGQKASDDYSEDWIIIQVDLTTGRYSTYPGKFEMPTQV